MSSKRRKGNSGSSDEKECVAESELLCALGFDYGASELRKLKRERAEWYDELASALNAKLDRPKSITKQTPTDRVFLVAAQDDVRSLLHLENVVILWQPLNLPLVKELAAKHDEKWANKTLPAQVYRLITAQPPLLSIKSDHHSQKGELAPQCSHCVFLNHASKEAYYCGNELMERLGPIVRLKEKCKGIGSNEPEVILGAGRDVVLAVIKRVRSLLRELKKTPTMVDEDKDVEVSHHHRDKSKKKKNKKRDADPVEEEEEDDDSPRPGDKRHRESHKKKSRGKKQKKKESSSSLSVEEVAAAQVPKTKARGGTKLKIPKCSPRSSPTPTVDFSPVRDSPPLLVQVPPPETRVEPMVVEEPVTPTVNHSTLLVETLSNELAEERERTRNILAQIAPKQQRDEYEEETEAQITEDVRQLKLYLDEFTAAQQKPHRGAILCV
jgi:hypothetical protein